MMQTSVFCTLGNAQRTLDLHLQELCKKASPADSGRNGDHRVHCHTPHCQGTENPTGSLSDPRNAPERNQHCGYQRERNTPQFAKLCSLSRRDMDNTKIKIIKCMLWPGFGLCWLQAEADCAHPECLWPSQRGHLGTTPLPNSKAGTAWVSTDLWRSLSPTPAHREGMQIKSCPVGFGVSWKLQIPRPLWAANSRPWWLLS